MLLFNFIFSNINIIYFILISILTVTKVINNKILQIAILTLFMLIQFAVRSYLEIDAMTKAKFLSKDYMENKNICTKEEQDKLLEEYEKINKQGIPFTVFNLLFNGLIKIAIYVIISIIM